MDKITVNPKKGEDLNRKVIEEMAKYRAKGYVIRGAGYDWFCIEKQSK